MGPAEGAWVPERPFETAGALIYSLSKLEEWVMGVDAGLEVVVRGARAEDAAVCGRICYEAFSAINAAHGFPCDFPSPEVAAEAIKHMFANPGFWWVVAEVDGRVVGSNCLDERSVIAGVGPITVDPRVQNKNVGRKLMEAVLERARGWTGERGSAGVRLVQAAFHNRSLSLYTRLGFDVREPLSCFQGRPVDGAVEGCAARTARVDDLEACNALARRVHGFERGVELAQGIEQGSAVVVERGGRVTGYASALAFFGHATAETNLDLQAMIGAVIGSGESFGGPGILVPSRNGELMRWCMARGLRVVQPMTLMSMGLYNEPTGVWMPSVSF